MLAKSKLMWVVVLVAVLSLAGIGPATAETTPGSASSAAVGNETGLVTINPGQEHWYTFQSTIADPQAGNREIMVLLGATPRGSVVFDVWTPDNLQRAAYGKTDSNARSIGSGTLHPVKDGDGTYDRYGGNLAWTGASGWPQTYMINVKSKAAAPAQYNLMVNGNYVQVPYGTLADQAAKQGAVATGGSQQAQATQPAGQATATAAKTGAKATVNQKTATATPAETPAPTPTSRPAGPVAGDSPNTALPLDWAMHQINPGENQWYVLNYPGELKNGVIPNGTIVITALPYGSANFEIWSKDRLRALELGDTRIGVPVGTGMLHPTTRDSVTTDQWDGKPAWTNRSSIPAQFLIRVQTTGSAPSNYSLEYVQK
jgi:hypothetical protein